LEELGSFLAGFFFFGSDFSAGSAADPTSVVEMEAEASFTGVVPSLALAVLPPPSDPPPAAFPIPKATAKATTAAAMMIPI
jgi:hypothetical protein